MPTNFPDQRLPLVPGLAHQQQAHEDERAQLYVVLAFAMSPVMLFLMLWLVATPEQLSDVWICDEPQCMAP